MPETEVLKNTINWFEILKICLPAIITGVLGIIGGIIGGYYKGKNKAIEIHVQNRLAKLENRLDLVVENQNRNTSQTGPVTINNIQAPAMPDNVGATQTNQGQKEKIEK